MFITNKNITNKLIYQYMNKKLLILVILAALIIPFSASKAFEVKTDNSILLNKDEMADGNVYASCGDMTINGTVNGDIIALCKNITINGLVNGDVIAFADKIEINGIIKGNVRVAGTKISINGSINRNVNVFGSEINFGKDSSVKWDALIAGVNGIFAGNIDGNLHGLVSTALISGKIGKNVNLSLEDKNLEPQFTSLTISKDAVIAGGVSYTSSRDLKLENPSSIAGSINRQTEKNSPANPLNYLWKIFYVLSSLVLVAITIISLQKNLIKETNQNINKNWWSNLLIGFAFLLFSPLVIIMLMITFVGLPLALIMLATYLSALIIAIIFASSYIGELLINKISKKEVNPYLSAITGLIIFSILSVLPYIGSVFSIILISIGLGALFTKIRNKHND